MTRREVLDAAATDNPGAAAARAGVTRKVVYRWRQEARADPLWPGLDEQVPPPRKPSPRPVCGKCGGQLRHKACPDCDDVALTDDVLDRVARVVAVHGWEVLKAAGIESRTVRRAVADRYAYPVIQRVLAVDCPASIGGPAWLVALLTGRVSMVATAARLGTTTLTLAGHAHVALRHQEDNTAHAPFRELTRRLMDLIPALPEDASGLDPIVTLREVLAAGRGRGQGFGVVWPVAVDEACAGTLREEAVNVRAACGAMRDMWQAAFEHRPDLAAESAGRAVMAAGLA